MALTELKGDSAFGTYQEVRDFLDRRFAEINFRMEWAKATSDALKKEGYEPEVIFTYHDHDINVNVPIHEDLKIGIAIKNNTIEMFDLYQVKGLEISKPFDDSYIETTLEILKEFLENHGS